MDVKRRLDKGEVKSEIRTPSGTTALGKAVREGVLGTTAIGTAMKGGSVVEVTLLGNFESQAKE